MGNTSSQTEQVSSDARRFDARHRTSKTHRFSVRTMADSASSSSSSGCWGANGSVYSHVVHHGLLFTVAHVGVISGGWCGNGKKFTSYTPAYYHNGIDFPGYCWASMNEDTGSVLQQNFWMHAQVATQVSIGVGSVCSPIGSEPLDASISMNNDGTWDPTYNAQP